MIDPAILPLAQQVNEYLTKSGSYERVHRWLLNKNAYPVVVFGASGTGKTAFLRSLAGLKPMIRRDDRTDEVTHAVKKLRGIYLELIDTPGEERHRDKRLELIREVARKGSVGIVNVVSHGYHEGKASRSDAVVDQRPQEVFLQHRRQIEADLIEEWLGILCGQGGCAKWVLTVVSKGDLWWTPETEHKIAEYYETGSYGQKFSQYPYVAHSVKVYSSLNHLFFDKVPMTGFYEDSFRDDHRAAVLGHLIAKASEHG